MPTSPLPLDALVAALRGGGIEALAEPEPLVLVDLDDGAQPPDDLELTTRLATVVVGLTAAPDPEAHPAARLSDLALHPDDVDLAGVRSAIEAHPVAARALALVLRGAERRSLDDGLLVESATYSSLQAGPEFAAWRAATPRRDRPPVPGDVVALDRVGDVLHITLDRPHVRNALNTAMRDQLVDALAVAAADPSIAQVHLRGAGPSFCAGGDLDEFGSFADPASAHLVRLQQSAGRGIAQLSDRVTAFLHGSCVGSGIELPAFAGRVVAHPAATFALPEVQLGLIPGAGGTVSLPRRIGRHRTCRLALCGRPIDAATALAWGLVDEVDEAASG